MDTRKRQVLGMIEEVHGRVRHLERKEKSKKC